MTGTPSSPDGRTVVCVSNAASGDISVLALDATTGALSEVQRLALGGVVMALAVSPDRRRLYASRRSAPFAVYSLALGRDGRLTLLDETALPASMAYLATDQSGRWLYSASYDSHCIAISPIGANGVVGAVHQTLHTERHAHCIRPAPDNRAVWVACLGADVLLRYDVDVATGTFSPSPDARVEVAAWDGRRPGPRHLAFSANGAHLYVLCELDASIAVYAHAVATGTLSLLQRLAFAPATLDGAPWAAELRLTPDGCHLYASERRSHTVAVFGVGADGHLQLHGHTDTERQPRGMAIDPSGRCLFAAGQRSNRLAVHILDPASGRLTAGAAVDVGDNPNWVEAIALPSD